MNTFVWLIRREFWENRAIWTLPAGIGAALILGALFGRIDIVASTTPEQTRIVGGFVLFAFGVTFFAVMSLYSTWYLLDCLYADRKDHSVLFWKSLPISDTASVLAKLCTGLIVIPLVYFLAADVTTLLLAFIISVRARNSFASALWQPDVWLQLQALWSYLIVTTAIWYLPFAGWLIVVSAWARRAVMLWSVMPLLAAYLLERWFLGTHYVGTQLVDRTLGYIPRAFHDFSDRRGWVSTIVDNDTISLPGSVWRMLDPVGFLSSPATWLGAAFGAALVFVAIQLRLRRTDA